MVIWNLIRRCNLTCKHCYSISADTNFPGELSTDQVHTVMDDPQGGSGCLCSSFPEASPSCGRTFLKSPSGPRQWVYVGLSSNGTLITEENIAKIAECDFNYAGSPGRPGATHDKFRRPEGAFKP